MTFVSEEDRLSALQTIDPNKEPLAWLSALDRRIEALVNLRHAFARACQLGCFVPPDEKPPAVNAVDPVDGIVEG